VIKNLNTSNACVEAHERASDPRGAPQLARARAEGDNGAREGRVEDATPANTR